MSKEEDFDERQDLYARKYHKMVKQHYKDKQILIVNGSRKNRRHCGASATPKFDELIEIMDSQATQLKRRRVSSSPRKSRSTSAGGGGSHIAPPPDGISNGRDSAVAARGRSNSKPAATSQLNNNCLLVETITRHLQDLKNENPSDSDCFNPATK